MALHVFVFLLMVCLLCWLLRLSVPKNVSPMALIDFFTAPSLFWADGNRVAHGAVSYPV
jgi:hypothetical protein